MAVRLRLALVLEVGEVVDPVPANRAAKRHGELLILVGEDAVLEGHNVKFFRLSIRRWIESRHQLQLRCPFLLWKRRP